MGRIILLDSSCCAIVCHARLRWGRTDGRRRTTEEREADVKKSIPHAVMFISGAQMHGPWSDDDDDDEAAAVVARVTHNIIILL